MKAVKSHLNGCSKCSKLYSDMKNESEYSLKGSVTDSDIKGFESDDQKLLKRINRRLSKKLRITSDEDQTENTADLISITIPDFADIDLSRETLDRTEYVSLIKFSSAYPLRTILWDHIEENGENILVVKGFRTTFLSGKNDSLLETQYTVDFRKTDKVVYREKDGTEILLWDAE